ncbi:MAG: hypothetical protein CMH83_02855 [Nocardioides sp.]|nr:hypothetical protein [Nocardioides sp.]
MSESTPEHEPAEAISDDQLPDDLQPGEDNPLADGLEPGETAGDLLEDGKTADESPDQEDDAEE